MTRPGGRVRRLVRWLVWSVLVLPAVVLVWVAGGAPIWLDQWLDVTQPPAPAAAIVVLGGGSDGRNLPLPQGWERLQAASELFADGLAPVVLITGGGTETVSEAEIYANAAVWLGIPREAILFETGSQGTADHGRALNGFSLPGGATIGPATPLLVVTSRLHSRRALMGFAEAGFTSVRTVSQYAARLPPDRRRAPSSGAAVPPALLQSSVASHRPSGKRYDDVLFRLAYRSFDLFMTLREAGAILVERLR